ncbi:pectinesterase family protein [Butyrivibrio sp. CB08]|uniref:pectinesterase family protein n=1 Tax=Butyrivibrio sp. CB08 TaxID=2364879 RepID=UPI001314D39F|nr:pectinesterase family protein [Butyrivibrio sp. CB08]
MLEIRVAKSGGDFSSVQEAIEAVPYEESAKIVIGEGVYREKIFCEKKDITFVGAGIDKTVIDFDDYANEVMPDGSKRGTFRSYTAFFGGKRVEVRDMTIRNSAGDGRVVGQAVAVYADADVCLFENVEMNGCQDTLFCAPLPRAERQKNGFMGPRVMTERRLTKQYYKNCIITGDVDFIFGGADAVFDDCKITCNDRQHGGFADLAGASGGAVAGGKLDKDQIDVTERLVNGYVTATCGRAEDLGFVFRNCVITGAKGCEEGSVFLGRPWREEARTVFLNCACDKSIAPQRFSGWGGITKDEPETFYGEFGTRLIEGEAGATGAAAFGGELVDLSGKNPWVKDIDEKLAEELSARADEVVKVCAGK